MKIEDVRSNDDLQKAIKEGANPKYIYFWGHRKKGSEEISKSCFSQWYESSFEVDGITYLCAEHYMMAEKALLFNDEETRKKIIEADNPGAAKKFGREVRNFNEELWIKNRFDIVVKGNIEKFKQNKDLLDFIQKTNNRVLVEASPVDKIWGIGMAEDDSKITDPHNWNGLNLLGYALMEARSVLNI